MKAVVFEPTGPISVHSFLDNINTACDTYTIHEGAAKRLLPRLICEPLKADLSNRITAHVKNRKHEKKGIIYYQGVTYLLETYTNEEVITKDEADIRSFKPPSGMTAVRNFEVPCEKALRCGTVHNKPWLRKIFIEGLHFSIHYSMRSS